MLRLRGEASPTGTTVQAHCPAAAAGGRPFSEPIRATPAQAANAKNSSNASTATMAITAATLAHDTGAWPVARPVWPLIRKRNTWSR